MSNLKLRTDLKQRFGGRCHRCGYDRCFRALHFHHTDGSAKQDWSGTRGHAAPAEITAHPERFVLLCANCHIEEHERLDDERRHWKTCRTCGKQFASQPGRDKAGRGVYCSRACQHGPRRLVAVASLSERLHRHIRVVGECWEWTAYRLKGTPMLNVLQPNGSFAPKPARRVAYELHYGHPPSTPRVKAPCGYAGCVRPDPHAQLSVGSV